MSLTWAVPGLLGFWISGCSGDTPAKPPTRTLAEAREIALDLFRELDSFRLEKQLEVGLGGRPAVRLEGSWLHEGEPRRGIVYLVDNTSIFNVIHYTAPADRGLFEIGYPTFQKVIRCLKLVPITGRMKMSQQGEEKIMLCPDLQLEIRYPASWVYSLDELNRAIVFSGPRGEPTWLTTISFSGINKLQAKGR